MKNLILVLILLAFTGCGGWSSVERVPTPGPTVTVNVPVPGPTVTATPDPLPTLTPDQVEAATIQSLTDSENAYREGLGQTALTGGLSCTLYTITGGQYINSTSITGASQSPVLTGVSQVATFLLNTAVNQPDGPASDGLNVLPAALKANPAYQNLIKLICQGDLVVTTTGYYNFDIVSDDGSVVYVDGGRLIDNDGNHGATEKQGSKYLREGVHQFRFDFAQTGAGNQALVIKANGVLILPQYFLH